MITAGYMLVAMWVSFLGGSAVGHGVKTLQDRDAHKKIVIAAFEKNLYREQTEEHCCPEVAAL